MILGAICGLIVFGARSGDFSNIENAPAVIGFSLFLFGSFFKVLQTKVS